MARVNSSSLADSDQIVQGIMGMTMIELGCQELAKIGQDNATS
jgi:hypothetical protein